MWCKKHKLYTPGHYCSQCTKIRKSVKPLDQAFREIDKLIASGKIKLDKKKDD